MTTVLHLSDPHFGTELPPVCEALHALCKAQRPDLIVLSGDITQRARPGQFQAARAFMDRLGAPLLALPGNHDIPLWDLWSRLHHPYARYQRAFGDTLEPVHQGRDVLAIGVNTTRAWRHKHGEVSGDQVERVARLLEQAPASTLRLVVVHQPVAVRRRQDAHNLLRGREVALQRWAEAGADLVLGGHIHLPYVMPLPALSRPMWAVQAGTAVSSRVRAEAPHSVNLLRWSEAEQLGVCRIEQWDYQARAGRFVPTNTIDLQPSRATSTAKPSA